MYPLEPLWLPGVMALRVLLSACVWLQDGRLKRALKSARLARGTWQVGGLGGQSTICAVTIEGQPRCPPVARL
jgi:hypothetical protein